MTAPITQTSGMLALLIADSTNVHRSLDQLTQQASSGLLSDTYAGLGATAHVSLDLHPQIAALQTWQTNIGAASGNMAVTQTAMTRLQKIASDFNAQLNNLNGLDPQNVDVVAASARNALTEVAGLLDSKNGAVYVFAGQDTGNPPVPNPDAIATSGFATQIATAVAGLAANGAAATAASTLAVASSNAAGTSPFSIYLSQPAASIAPPLVQVGANRMQAVGLLASANTTATSTGSSTTGSAMRDLMRALATIGSLSLTQVNAAGFGDLIQDTRTSLGGAITALATDAGALGNVQSGLTATASQLGSVGTALTTQVSGAEDADMATTLSNLSQVQTQLQASYQLIAGLGGLSLVKYLPAA